VFFCELEQPELPAAKVTAVNQLQMGVLNCLTLVFPNKFWPDDSHLWTPIDYCDVNIYDCYHCCGKPILQMHRTGSESVRWESMSDAAIAEEALDIMRKVFPRMPAPTTFAYSRWNSDPFSKGSYSFARVGGSRRSFAECGRPVGSSLYFGGEHCHKEYNATAHGSLMSGRDNAQMILKVFGK
jgi:monoamine oxidase